MSKVPPPPPLPKQEAPKTNKQAPKQIVVNLAKSNSVCEWALPRPELQSTCIRNNLCLYNRPYRFKYRFFKSILQEGPTCGMVALSMLVSGDVTPDEIFDIAKTEGYSKNGEMLSCEDMLKLTNKILKSAGVDDLRVTVQKCGLFSDFIVDKLLSNSILLVPYDADFNHFPCQKNGHRAHWALVTGAIVVQQIGDAMSYRSVQNNVYALCKHGKSQYLAAWKMEDFEASNMNLWEFSPDREEDKLVYILPPGGVGGDHGLRNQFIMIEGI